MDSTTAARLIAIARNEIGTTEQPPGSNRNPYAAEVAPAYQGQPWCAIFVSWCFQHAGLTLPDTGLGPGLFTFCPSAVGYARAHGQAVYDARTGQGWGAVEPGDVVLFDWEHDGTSDHVGIVTALNPDGSISTVEGNTSDVGSQSNGGAVLPKRRLRPSVICVWRPPVAETKATGTIEEDPDMPAKFLVGPIADGPFAGRYATVTAEPAQHQLRCVLGAWEDGAGVEQFPAYVTSILHLDAPEVTAGLGHPVDWATFEFFRSPTDPRAFVVRDKDGDYTFRVAA